jgi:hypothetical protein
MPLRTTPNAFTLLALLPPGNVTRELALLKRRRFAALGDASGLALPDIAILALAPGSPSPEGRREAEMAMREAWEETEGSFMSSGYIIEGGFVYLSLGPAFDTLWSHLREAIQPFGAEADKEIPGLAPGRGLFIGKGETPEREMAFTFRQAFLALYELSLTRSGDALSATSWQEAARLPRPRQKGNAPLSSCPL